MITAALVKELRERTGVGMMECKKALENTNGNLDEAITLLRKSGQAKAAKKMGRVAAEGCVLAGVSADHSSALLLEINCETDFVSRDAGFVSFAEAVMAAGLANQVKTVDELNQVKLADGQTVLEGCHALVAKIGENIHVRRLQVFTATGSEALYGYTHGNKIAAVVKLSVKQPDLGKDLAMQVAATKPMAILPQDVPAELVAKERDIGLAQLKDSGKPEAIQEKIIAGKIKKFTDENSLVGQAFVKDPSKTVAQLLAEAKAEVLAAVRFELGDGIEKQEKDFAAEVQEMMK